MVGRFRSLGISRLEIFLRSVPESASRPLGGRVFGGGGAGCPMLVKSRLVGAIAALLPMAASALGLGEAQVASSLNQPLHASIAMLAASPDDLKDLTVTLAPREVFERVGVERSAFLSNLNFRAVQDVRGQLAIEIHSTLPVREPFLTFLVAVDWPRGHLVREYTLLLDPPVFESTPSAAAPILAPASGVVSSAAGAIERPVTETTPAVVTPSPARATEHTVRAGETLSAVIRAQGYSAAADVNRGLIATFRANPAAFDGNINRLRRGAILRVPPQSEWAQLGSDEASAEVHRQVRAWKGDPAAAHLRLVVPKHPPQVGEGTAAGAGRAQPSSEAAQMRRLLDLKNAELARLQSSRTTPKPVPAPAPAPVAVPLPPQPMPVAPTTEPAVSAAPAATAPAVPKPRKVTSTVVAPVAEPAMLDVLLDNGLTLIVGTLGVLLLALVGLQWRSRRRAAQESESFARPEGIFAFGTSLDGDPAQTHPSLSATPRAVLDERQRIELTPPDHDAGEYQPPPFNALNTQAIPHSATPGSPPLDSRLGAESSITLHDMDPIAEADFHIAYGLYTQAADILKAAIDLDPKRSDLKLKLLEGYFVAGDSTNFLAAARLLDRAAVEPSAWDRIVVMGRQIAPQEPLFAGRLDANGSMDLDLDTGSAVGALDFEIAGGDTVEPTASAADGFDARFQLDLDKDLLDLSATLDPDTLFITSPQAGHDDAPTPVGESTAEIALEELALADELLRGLSTARPVVSEAGLDAHGDAPTQLMPPLSGSSVTAAAGAPGESAAALLQEASQLLESFWTETATGPDPSQSATFAMPKLPPVGAGPAAEHIVLSQEESEQPTATVPVVSSPPSELPPSIAGLRLTDLNLGDEPFEFDLDDLARALQDDTLAQPGPDRSGFSTDLLATGLHVQTSAAHADADDYLPEDDVSRSHTNDLDLPELDPVTLSEVGTKLDLARAYLDMGDPDGARAILDEVLSEGSPSQKSEAQRLVETLPG